MRALVQDTYGSADVLELRDVDRPVPGDREVLVRVHAAGIDRGVWHLVTGLPYPARLAFGLRRPRVPVPGMLVLVLVRGEHRLASGRVAVQAVSFGSTCRSHT